MVTGERTGATSERARRSRSRVARWARGAVLLGAISVLIAPVARADERAGGEVGPTALAARLLEAADTRMKAKLEEARLLEAAGRRDAALAALAEVDKIYERTLELVRPLLVGAAPARQIVVVPSPPLATTPSRSRPSPPRLPFEPAPMVRAPKADPVPGAVAFLLRCQTDDGLFHVSVGRAPGDPEANPAHDGRATAMAILAILDAAPATLPSDVSVDMRRSIARAGTALAARANTRGALDPDLESHAYALWALATAYGDLAVAEWKPVLKAALGYALATRDVHGIWTSPSGPEGALRTTVTMLAALHECLPLTETIGREDEIRAAVDRARAAPAFDVEPGDETSRVARELIRFVPRGITLLDVAREGIDPSTGIPFPAAVPEVTTLNPFLVLWGTVLARAQWGGTESRAFVAWWNRVLVPSMDLQERGSSIGAGSWGVGPVPGGLSRLEATALCLLAWKVPTAEYANPVAR